MEMPRNLDGRTLHLLYLQTPGLLLRKKEKIAEASYATQIRDMARGIVLSNGVPRLDLLDPRANQYKLVGSDEERSIFVADRTSNSQTAENILPALADWIRKSPLRILEVPFRDRVFHVRLGNIGTETKIYQRVTFHTLSAVLDHPLPDLKPEECTVSFRSSAWYPDSFGRPVWVSFHDPALIKAPVVDCLEAIMRIFETNEMIVRGFSPATMIRRFSPDPQPIKYN